jgi:hypothetical protein
MAKQFIDDGEKGFIVRKKINENFSELYYNDSLFLSGSNLSLNYLTKYGNANTLLNSIVYDNGTNVGIGTTSPASKLHVVGGNIVGYSGATSSYTGVVVRNKTVTDYTIDGRIVVDTVNSPNKVIIGSETNHPLQIVTNNTQRVWIDSSGISTSGNLNVSGDVTISGNLSALGTTTQIDTKMYVTSAVSVTNTGTGPALTVKQTGSNDIATFFDDNNVAMIIRDGGNVGIGTNFPSQKLHVTNGQASGDVRILLGTGVNTLEFIRNGSADNWVRSYGGEFLIDQRANSSLIFRTNATEKLRITAAGNVGIGTTSPSTKLEINNSSTGVSSTWQGGTDFVKLFANNGEWSEQAIAFQETGTNVGAKIGVKNTANGAYDIIFANRSNSSLTSSLSERVRITHLGDVGIGTATPNEALTIVGNISASGKLYGTESANWDSVYTSVLDTSGNWDSVYTSVNSTSGNWDSVYTSVLDTSGNWDSVYTSVLDTSGNWDSVYTSVLDTSGNWDSVYTSVNSTSGNWDSVYTSVNSTSGNWD